MYLHAFRYSPKERAEIGRYAKLHGVAAAARYFSRQRGHTINESTIRSIANSYKVELSRKRAGEGEGDVELLPVKKRGRSLLIGEDIDAKVQAYIKRVRKGGGVVTARIAIAVAKGLLQSFNRSLLAEFGGPVELNKSWGYSLLRRMKYVQ